MSQGFQVYVVSTTASHKQYVGITTKGHATRFAAHLWHARKFGKCSALYAAMRKHGASTFSVSLLEECDSFEHMNLRERHWIKELNTMSPNGYNLTDGGDAGVMVPESIEKVRAFNKGRPLSKKNREGLQRAWDDPDIRAARCAKIKEAMNRPEVREKTGSWQRGVKKSPEHVAALREVKATRVICLDTEQVFEAITDAVNWVKSLGKYPKANHAKICRACKSPEYTAYGYRWQRC